MFPIKGFLECYCRVMPQRENKLLINMYSIMTWIKQRSDLIIQSVIHRQSYAIRNTFSLTESGKIESELRFQFERTKNE